MDAHTHPQHPLDGPSQHAVQDSPPTPAGRLDVQEPGDCLALVTHTFGRLPPESVVVIGLLDGRTGGHMRIDLEPALREPFGSARLIADCLAGEGSSPAPEAALVMLIGDRCASASQDETWRRSLDALRMILDSEYCVRIVQTWFIAARHVRDPLCSVPGCCDLPGRSIEELRVPTLAGLPGQSPPRETRPLDQAAAMFLEDAPAADPNVQALLPGCRPPKGAQRDAHTVGCRLQAWDLALRQQVDARQSRFQAPPASMVHAAGRGTEDTEDTAETVSEQARAKADQLSELLGQLHTGWDRDLLIPLATLGLEHATAGLNHQQGEDQTVLSAAGEQLLQEYAACFLGETAGRPDWERVDALESVLGALVPYARGAERENLLCLMAWIEWARGRGTAAGSFIDRCLQEFPDNEFSRLIERLMQLKGVCRWARVKQHSWSWSRSSHPG